MHVHPGSSLSPMMADIKKIAVCSNSQNQNNVVLAGKHTNNYQA